MADGLLLHILARMVLFRVGNGTTALLEMEAWY